MLQMKVVEKIKTRILFSVTFSQKSYFCETMSKNVVEPERQQLATWRRVAYWIRKATRAQAHANARGPTLTHTGVCNTYYFSTAIMVS
jgi:hypothetical protein